MNKILTTISVAVVFFLSLVNANAGSLTVYTAIEAEDLKDTLLHLMKIILI